MAEVNGTDHLVRHEKESKLKGYDNEGYHCQERSEDEDESASDDDRLRVVVTENGHRPEDDSHMSNGYVHDESNGHPTTVNGSAVIVIEENKSDSNMNGNREGSSQKPLDTRLHHYVPVDDIDRKILNGSDGTHVTIPEDAVINFTTGRVKVKKGSSNNSQVSNERESIPLETILPSYEAEDKIGIGEKAELEAELTNHKNGLWSEGHNTYTNAESPFGNSEKLNGTSKSSDEISLPVNNHRKCLSSDVSDTSSEQKSTGEKLYFTEENRKLCPGWRRVFVCGLILIIIAVALLLGVLAATGILLAESGSKNSRYESGHSLPSSDLIISQAGHSLNRPRPSFNKVPQKSSPPEGTNATTDSLSRPSSPAVSSKVPVLNDTSHSQTIVPNALVGEFTIDEIFTDDLKDNSSNGYQSLAKYIERELHGIFKRNGGIFDVLKILSFSPGSIKIKFVTIWASDRNVILSTKAEEIFKSYLRKNRNSLLAYPVELDSIHFIDVFDECRVQKGGCSYSCVWDYNTLLKMCVCQENMVLLADGKSCGPKPSTNVVEVTTPRSIDTSAVITEQLSSEGSFEITNGEDKTIPVTTIVPTLVTKAIISITELFHNLTSTEIPFRVTENIVNLQNLSIVESEFSPFDVLTTTEKYNVEQLTTTKMPITITHNLETQTETTTEILTITNNSVNEKIENDNQGSSVTETNIHFYESTTISPSEIQTTTTPLLTSDIETTTASYSASESETTTSLSVTNDSIDTLNKARTVPDIIDSHTETTTNQPSTEQPTSLQDLTTIGYHIKEETTEMYTLKSNTEFVTISGFDTTTEVTTAFVTDLEETTVSPNHITEATITTEVTHLPILGTAQNTSEVTESIPKDVTDINITETITSTKDLETTTMKSIEETFTDITDYRSATETLDEDMLNKKHTTPSNIDVFSNTEPTSPSDSTLISPSVILNETSSKIPHITDTFMTPTSVPLTNISQSQRPPEVRSFDDDYENETTTQNIIDLNSTNNFLNYSSPEPNKQPENDETLITVIPVTTPLPTNVTNFETTLFESTTKNSENHETTTHSLPSESNPVTNTENELDETTIHSLPSESNPVTNTENGLDETTTALEKIPQKDSETTLNVEPTSIFTTENPLIPKTHVSMNSAFDYTTIISDSEATAILSTEMETSTLPPIETETHSEITTSSGNTEAENVTLEISTYLSSKDILEIGTIHTTNDFETTENPLYSEETTIRTYNETTMPSISETTVQNIETTILTIIIDNSTNEETINSTATLKNTENKFNSFTTLEPITISDDLTTFENANTLQDSDLTSLETRNFSISNTEFPTNITPTLYPDFNETLTLATDPDHTLPTPPYHNGSEIEMTTESAYTTEMITLSVNDNETLYPFEIDSNFSSSTDIPFESSTLTTLLNESIDNITYFGEYDNFTTEAYDATNETTTNASTGIECREDQFLCEPLNICINETFMCDGIIDCPDGNDEYECKGTCYSNFMCPNSTTCIMSDARCDGIWDCENGTDEENCTPTECAQHEVMCLDHSKCIKPGHICDWKYNCLDRSDEVGCVERTTCESNGRFFCNDGLCIPWSLKCDGEHDCKEGEDEGNCTCLSDEFQCNDGKCLKSSSRCDGHQDCHDADDEMGCVTVDNQHIVSTYEPYSGTWGLLCAEDWNLDDGQYLCQELGFGHALNVDRVHVSFNGTWMAMKRENLTDASLWTERVSFVESCTSGLAAAVECQKFVCGEYSGLLHRRRRDVISTSSNQWPFIGYTSTFQSNKGCISEILTPIWLITSADCLLSISKEPFNGSDWYVRTNIGRDIEADVAQNHEVLRIINHPHSSKFRSLILRDYDVALIRLKHALVFVSDKIGAICLPEEQVPPGITCFSGVLGTERPRAPPPPILTINSLALQIMDRRNCNRVEDYNGIINSRMLCTQSSEGHTICDNDEGTPLMCLGGINKWFLAGMLSYQRFCDVYSKHPAVFSNLFPMRKFVDQVTGQKQYEVSYDSSIYIIIPPTTPSPTMPETTTPEMITLSTTDLLLTNTTHLLDAEFENGTESILDNLQEFNGTTEMNEGLLREEYYTTVQPEELIGLHANATVSDDYWNETTTMPFEVDSGVSNTTLGELEKSADEINRTHDDLMTLLNYTHSTDGTFNDSTVLNTDEVLSNVTILPTSETTTISLDSTNTPTSPELNDSSITTTEFMTPDNESTIMMEKSSGITEINEIITDSATDATTTAYSSLIYDAIDTVDHSQLTTSSVDLTTTDTNSVFNDTIEIFQPVISLNNESKVVSQPLLSLINYTDDFKTPTTVLNLETLANSTENISTDITLIETKENTYPSSIDSETTMASTMAITDFAKNVEAEATTQPMLDETEAVTFVVDGEPEGDIAFSLFKHPDGLKIESYRMLDDNESSNVPKENMYIPIKEDDNVRFTTESEVALMSTVATTIFPEEIKNETEKHDLMFGNVTHSFRIEPINSTSSYEDSSVTITSGTEIKSDNATIMILSPSNTTENHDLMFESIKDQIMPKLENLVNNNINYSMPLIYEDDPSLDIANKSSFSTNETELHGLVFYNVTEKTVPKSAGLIKEDINYSFPLTFEEDSKLDIENKTSLLLSNDTKIHNLIFYNLTDKIAPKLVNLTIDVKNDSVPLVFKDSSEIITENTSIPLSNATEASVFELDNESDEFMPTSFDSIIDNVNYSSPLTFENETKLSPVDTSLLSFTNLTENDYFKLDNKTEDLDTISESPIVNDMNYSTPLMSENNNTYESLLHPLNLTENSNLEPDSEKEDLVLNSEALNGDVMNQSIPLTVENDNKDESSLPHTPNSAKKYDLATENITNKIISESVGLNRSEIINYTLPLIFEEDLRYKSANESSLIVERDKTIANISEPELDIASTDDSTMKMHLISEELNVLPNNDSLTNFPDCGTWAEDSAAIKLDSKNPFKLWPALGFLEKTTDGKKCPSTVISPNYVITSLNCLISSDMDLELEPEKWTYVGGLFNNDTSKEFQTLPVKKIIPYPGKFLLLNEHDVALVQMNSSIEMNEYSKSACLAKEESKPGKECFTAGWNKNYSDGDIQSKFYSFPITIMSTEECNNTINYNGILIDNLLCGIRKEENIQNCYMNFGSPLFCLNENKHWELKGILNRPDPCDIAKPIVFSDILSVTKWINEILINDDIILDKN